MVNQAKIAIKRKMIEEKKRTQAYRNFISFESKKTKFNKTIITSEKKQYSYH